MCIAYMTTDEVNLIVALKLARRLGASVSMVGTGGPVSTDRFDAVLHDLDAVPRDQRSAFLERLGLGATARPTAVHGYGLSEEQAEALRRHGIAVAQRLDTGLIRELLKGARRSPATVPPDDATTELTWVNLAE
jgi:hypothetical protein